MKAKDRFMAFFASGALIGSAGWVFAASGDAAGGSGILVVLFLVFGALILVFQLIPGLVLFSSMLKGLFSSVGKEESVVAVKTNDDKS